MSRVKNVKLFDIRPNGARTIVVKTSKKLTDVTFFGTLVFMSARVLTQAEKDIAFEYALTGKSYQLTALTLGFTTDMAFFKYRQKDPIFAKELEAARIAGCEYIEDKMLSAVEDYVDPQRARVAIEAFGRVLAFRKPERYGQRIDMTINGTISLSADIQAANERVALLTQRDVTPQLQKLNDIADLL